MLYGTPKRMVCSVGTMSPAQAASTKLSAELSSVLRRNIIFVSGKGGVGKTVVSHGVAKLLARSGKRVLWATFEDPTRPAGEFLQTEPGLWRLNCDATLAFEEYASMKIGGGPLAKLFLGNKLIKYLAKAAPGIHELVLLGKIWFERLNYDFVVCDMPSTGYGLTMFQATINFSRLFHGSPIHKDAESMLATFHDPNQCGHLIVSLPEEMPLQESLDLRDFLVKLFPANAPAFVVNRRFPVVTQESELPVEWPKPLAESPADYARKRAILENHNLRIWREAKIAFEELMYSPPGQDVADHLCAQLRELPARTKGAAS